MISNRNRINVGRELLNVPFPDMVTQLAVSIAEAQSKLDQESIRILRIMGDQEEAPVTLPYTMLDDTGHLVDKNMTTSMIGAGFQPTFYQFAETIIEVKMVINANYEEESEEEKKGTQTTTSYNRSLFGGRRLRITSTPIDASYSSKYNYNIEGTSTLRTRLVPVPPNSIIQQQIDMRTQYMQMEFDLASREMELAMEVKKAEIQAKLAKFADKEAKYIQQ